MRTMLVAPCSAFSALLFLLFLAISRQAQEAQVQCVSPSLNLPRGCLLSSSGARLDPAHHASAEREHYEHVRNGQDDTPEKLPTGEESGSAQGSALPGAGRGRWRRQRRGGGSAGAATRTGRPKRSFMAIAEPMTSARSQAVMAISAPTHRKMDTFGGKCLRHAEARSSRLTSPRRIDSACARGTG